MKEPVAIEFLCYGCGTQGLTHSLDQASRDSEGDTRLSCPHCGKAIHIAGYFLVTKPIEPVEAAAIF